MDVSQTSEHIAQDSLDVSIDTFTNMISLLSILGNEDSFSIFLYASKGFSSSKLAIIDLGLSQKRFYTRLKDLIEIGFIVKDKGMYKHTSLGNIFYKIGLSLTGILEKKERMGLFDEFNNADSFSLQDFDKIKTMVSQGSTNVSGILDLVFLPNKSDQIQMLPTYENYMDKLVAEVNKSKSSIIFASKNIDMKIIDSLIESMNRGVKVKVISKKYDFEDKSDKLQMMLSPKLVMSMLEYFSSAELEDQMRECEIPFSFCILDGNKCFFELPGFRESTFSIAFFIIDKEIGSKFSLYHNALWEVSEKISIPNLLKKINK